MRSIRRQHRVEKKYCAPVSADEWLDRVLSDLGHTDLPPLIEKETRNPVIDVQNKADLSATRYTQDMHDAQYDCISESDKKYPQLTIAAGSSDQDVNIQQLRSDHAADLEARERGALARAAYKLPAAVVRDILLTTGCHPCVNVVDMSGKLVLPDLKI